MKLSRRGFLRGLAAVLAVGAAPVAVKAATKELESPVGGVKRFIPGKQLMMGIMVDSRSARPYRTEADATPFPVDLRFVPTGKHIPAGSHVSLSYDIVDQVWVVAACNRRLEVTA